MPLDFYFKTIDYRSTVGFVLCVCLRPSVVWLFIFLSVFCWQSSYFSLGCCWFYSFFNYFFVIVFQLQAHSIQSTCSMSIGGFSSVRINGKRRINTTQYHCFDIVAWNFVNRTHVVRTKWNQYAFHRCCSRHCALLELNAPIELITLFLFCIHFYYLFGVISFFLFFFFFCFFFFVLRFAPCAVELTIQNTIDW